MTDPYETLLAPYACRASQSKGRLLIEAPSETRNAFQRDRDRIIHSSAFRRLKYKTQVFVYYEGDHYRTRLSHTLEVSQIARVLARNLRVQEDLAETVALAHDLGHPPFGHIGEDALAECLKDFGGFDHNDQSLRVVTNLEKHYVSFDGLNLSWELLEGLAKHNGPITRRPLPPTLAEIDGKFDLQLDKCASLEAQIGNLADDIAYNNHDIDDGLRAGFFAVTDLFDLSLVGEMAREIHAEHPNADRTRAANEIVRRLMGTMVRDVLDETSRRLHALNPQSPDDIRNADRAMAAFSDEMLPDIAALRKFLMANMYRHEKIDKIREKMTAVVRDLFGAFFGDPAKMPPEWQALAAASDGGDTAKARIVLDYVAGMTDRFALQEHGRLFDSYAIQGLPSG